MPDTTTVGPRRDDPCACNCGKTITFFEDVELKPGTNKDSGKALDVDCYHFLHVWVLAKNTKNLAMDNVRVECVFEIPGKMGAAGLADLTNPYTAANQPIPMQTNSGPPNCGFGGFIMRVPVVGPAVRVIVINSSTLQTYKFSVYGYLTR